MEILISDIVIFEGRNDVVGTLGRPGWSWRQKLTQKRLALDITGILYGIVENICGYTT